MNEQKLTMIVFDERVDYHSRQIYFEFVFKYVYYNPIVHLNDSTDCKVLSVPKKNVFLNVFIFDNICIHVREHKDENTLYLTEMYFK